MGGQLRDGFNLGVKHAGGKLGGLATNVIVQDDELKPDVAVGKVKQLIERDKVDFVVGPCSPTSCWQFTSLSAKPRCS